jgi:hypothetical protein
MNTPRLHSFAFRFCGAPAVAVTAVLAASLAAAAQAEAPEQGNPEVRPLRVAICLGPGRRPLAELDTYMEATYRVECDWVEAEKAKSQGGSGRFGDTPFSNLEALDRCDVILSNFYRTSAPEGQMPAIKRAFTTKPVVGLRKAHHGFQNWPAADREVFGVDYRGHYFGPELSQRIAEGQKNHPLVKGFDPILPAGGLYRHLEPAEDVVPLIEGAPKDRPLMAQTWLRVNPETGQRVFYTRYDPDDLEDPGVRDMVIRAIFWAAGKDPDKYRR